MTGLCDMGIVAMAIGRIADERADGGCSASLFGWTGRPQERESLFAFCAGKLAIGSACFFSHAQLLFCFDAIIAEGYT